MADVGHDGVKGKGWDRSQKDQSEYRIKCDLAKGKSDAKFRPNREYQFVVGRPGCPDEYVECAE